MIAESFSSSRRRACLWLPSLGQMGPDKVPGPRHLQNYYCFEFQGGQMDQLSLILQDLGKLSPGK